VSTNSTTFPVYISDITTMLVIVQFKSKVIV
jgi:hypothetical protein